MRMMQQDESMILAKRGDGTIVQLARDGVQIYGYTDESVPVIITPAGLMAGGKMVDKSAANSVASNVDEKDAKALKAGIADTCIFAWMNAHSRRMAEVQGPSGRWVPVKRKDNEVVAPFAFGEQVDGLVHMGDTILCKRERDFHMQVAADRAMLNNPENYLKQVKDQATEDMESRGAKGFSQTVERADSDSLELSETSAG
jgi:hypothetical protein